MEHTNQIFDIELEKLVNKLMQLGGLNEQQLQHIQSLLEEPEQDIFNLIAENEIKIDSSEIEIDKDCARIIALRQPAASDLRLILSISHSVRDLERIGDELLKVAEMIMSVKGEHNVGPIGMGSVSHIVDYLYKTLQEVLHAFNHSDVASAVKLVRIDKDIDKEFQRTTREMITYMMEDAKHISHVLNVLWSIRSLERVGSHINNIAEQLIYSVKGIDVRHQSMSELVKRIDR